MPNGGHVRVGPARATLSKSFGIERATAEICLRKYFLAFLSGADQVVDLMSERGLVARRPDPGHGRSMLATLTRQGMTAIRKAYPEHLQSEAALRRGGARW
jgi:hypothetical protein